MKKLKEKKSLRNEKGITLIALIITIIVLLILAAISVGMLRTDNSILKQSRNAKAKTNEGQVRDNVQLALYNVVGQAALAETDDLSSYMEKAIEEYYSEEAVSVSVNKTAEDKIEGYTVTITVSTDETYTVTIDSEGKITGVTAN